MARLFIGSFGAWSSGEYESEQSRLDTYCGDVESLTESAIYYVGTYVLYT